MRGCTFITCIKSPLRWSESDLLHFRQKCPLKQNIPKVESEVNNQKVIVNTFVKKKKKFPYTRHRKRIRKRERLFSCSSKFSLFIIYSCSSISFQSIWFRPVTYCSAERTDFSQFLTKKTKRSDDTHSSAKWQKSLVMSLKYTQVTQSLLCWVFF